MEMNAGKVLLALAVFRKKLQRFPSRYSVGGVGVNKILQRLFFYYEFQMKKKSIDPNFMGE
jgi:hypothetical protein